MLRLDRETTARSPSRSVPRAAASGGVLFLMLLVGSWLIAIGVGWGIWQLLPL